MLPPWPPRQPPVAAALATQVAPSRCRHGHRGSPESLGALPTRIALSRWVPWHALVFTLTRCPSAGGHPALHNPRLPPTACRSCSSAWATSRRRGMPCTRASSRPSTTCSRRQAPAACCWRSVSGRKAPGGLQIVLILAPRGGSHQAQKPRCGARSSEHLSTCCWKFCTGWDRVLVASDS